MQMDQIAGCIRYYFCGAFFSIQSNVMTALEIVINSYEENRNKNIHLNVFIKPVHMHTLFNVNAFKNYLSVLISLCTFSQRFGKYSKFNLSPEISIRHIFIRKRKKNLLYKLLNLLTTILEVQKENIPFQDNLVPISNLLIQYFQKKTVSANSNCIRRQSHKSQLHQNPLFFKCKTFHSKTIRAIIFHSNYKV